MEARMRVIIREPVHLEHQVLNEGVEVDLPDGKAKELIRERLAVPADGGGGNGKRRKGAAAPAEKGG